MSVMKFAEEIFAWYSGKTIVFEGFRDIISPYPDIIDRKCRLVPNVRGLTDGFYVLPKSLWFYLQQELKYPKQSDLNIFVSR